MLLGEVMEGDMIEMFKRYLDGHMQRYRPSAGKCAFKISMMVNRNIVGRRTPSCSVLFYAHYISHHFEQGAISDYNLPSIYKSLNVENAYVSEANITVHHMLLLEHH